FTGSPAIGASRHFTSATTPSFCWPKDGRATRGRSGRRERRCYAVSATRRRSPSGSSPCAEPARRPASCRSTTGPRRLREAHLRKVQHLLDVLQPPRDLDLLFVRPAVVLVDADLDRGRAREDLLRVAE